jgi:hypothetical protein
MYPDKPNLSDLTPQQLVQLIQLAESYAVPKVVAAAARRMGQLQPEQLTLEMVLQVMALPESCLQLKCFQEVKDKAGDQLQQEFGDLDVVWGDSSKAEQLLELPYAAMLQMVQDDRTKVASEDTIVYTLRRWLAQHPDTSSKQKQQLADTVRLPLCSATFLSSPDAVAWLLDAGYTQRELLMACVLHGSLQQQQDTTIWASSEQRTAWQQKRRHSSSKRTADITWTVPLADVRGLVEQEADQGIRRMGMPKPSLIWHGRELQLWLALDDGDTHIGLYVTSANKSYAWLSGCLQASCTAGRTLRGDVQGGVGPGILRGLLKLGPVASADREWAAVEAALRQQDLVHADGCLHLQATITCIK